MVEPPHKIISIEIHDYFSILSGQVTYVKVIITILGYNYLLLILTTVIQDLDKFLW